MSANSDDEFLIIGADYSSQFNQARQHQHPLVRDSVPHLQKSSENAPAVTLNQTFNTLGQRATETATINGIADFLNTYSYDSAGRLSQLTQQDGNSSAGYVVTSKRVDLSYDAAGRFIGISRYQSLTTSQAVASSAYLYDAAGRLTSLQHTGMENGATAGNPLSGYTFTWDSADRLTSVNSVKDGLVNYSYDSTGQVTGADFTGQTDESFTYDANGNRTSVLPGSPDPAVTIGLHNRILNDGKFTYTYDAEGNRTAKTDNVSGSKVEYTWNHANLLTAVVYKTSNNVVTKSVAYQYDALGRRIGKSVDDNGNGTVDRRESYIYDGAGLLSSFSTGIGGEGARRADEGAAIHISGPNGVMGQHGWVDQMVLSFVDPDGDSSSPSQLASRNLYGDAVDQIFASESGSGDVFWALTDHQGTPRDWVTRSASGTTTIAKHTRYSAFGAIESVTGSLSSTLAPSPASCMMQTSTWTTEW